MLVFSLVWLILLDRFDFNEAANRRYNFEVLNLTCSRRGAVLKDMKCSFAEIATNRYSIDVYMSLTRQLAQNAEVAMKIYIQPPNGDKILQFLNVKLNICETLKRQNIAVPMIRSIVNEIMRKSNVPFSCPIVKDFVYNLTNFILTDSIFPVYTFFVNFNFTLNFMNDYKSFAELLLEGRTVPK
ncbi:uncharacterized protein LOC109612918 [Musca domestica]|uniref:Uncharacterized protein LOC109612918 n=1 Tax=Musca domestica TaxID=7370 RepID=A0A9J7DG22_MUSDO|nr:uncharacterized protein LOC109612918 [Musca domestica]